MFNYLAKCGWLFDGFFSHWLLEFNIHRLIDKFNDQSKDFRKRRLGPGLPPWAGGTRAACENPSTDR